MPRDLLLENGPQPEKGFLDLIKAAQEKRDCEKSILTGKPYLVIEITPPYKAIIQYFMQTQYPKVR
jgi:hypothetical protein